MLHIPRHFQTPRWTKSNEDYEDDDDDEDVDDDDDDDDAADPDDGAAAYNWFYTGKRPHEMWREYVPDFYYPLIVVIIIEWIKLKFALYILCPDSINTFNPHSLCLVYQWRGYLLFGLNSPKSPSAILWGS